MTDFDISELLNALDNDDNENIIKLDHAKISKIKNDILQRLGISGKELKILNKKLKFYKFVDELPDLKYGSYIRWIPLIDPDNIHLMNGGFVCEMKVIDSGIAIICKNRFNRIFQLRISENLIFQKLTNQEQIILSAMDYINDGSF